MKYTNQKTTHLLYLQNVLLNMAGPVKVKLEFCWLSLHQLFNEKPRLFAVAAFVCNQIFALELKSKALWSSHHFMGCCSSFSMHCVISLSLLCLCSKLLLLLCEHNYKIALQSQISSGPIDRGWAPFQVTI